MYIIVIISKLWIILWQKNILLPVGSFEVVRSSCSIQLQCGILIYCMYVDMYAFLLKDKHYDATKACIEIKCPACETIPVSFRFFKSVFYSIFYIFISSTFYPSDNIVKRQHCGLNCNLYIYEHIQTYTHTYKEIHIHNNSHMLR